MTRDEFDQILSQHGLVCIGETTWHIAQFIVAHEREACAQACDAVEAEYKKLDEELGAQEDEYYHGTSIGGQLCAKAIRARGKK